MGKAHEPNVQRDPVEARREPGQLTPDSGGSPARDEDIKRNTNLEPGSMPGPFAPFRQIDGPDVKGIRERPVDDKNTVAEPKNKRTVKAHKRRAG